MGPLRTQVEVQSASTEPVFAGSLEPVEAGTLPARAGLLPPAAEAQHRRVAFPAGRERALSFAQVVPVRCHHPGNRSHNRQV
jgi:hypothetical protein